jgi:hypothetical protein
MPRQAVKNEAIYIEVDRARTRTGRKCCRCQGTINMGEHYLHMNRNSHLFVLCGKCLVLLATKVIKANPMVKADVVADQLAGDALASDDAQGML